MERWIRTDRSNERQLRRQQSRDGDRGDDGGRGRYQRLLRVDIKNGYYASDGSEAACPDFVALPTPPTADLMRAIGLLLLREPASFSVLYDARRAQGLFSYLRQNGTPPDSGAASQHWTRLSFVLSLTNPRFVNFTDVPVDLDPYTMNFYFSNQQAHRVDTTVLLTRTDHVDAGALLPVVGSQVRIATPDGVVEVIVRDISGEVVLRELRCVPKPDGSSVCRNEVFLDFSGLPEGKYTIERIKRDAADPDQWAVLYTLAAPIPLCFIDLLFSQPTTDSSGIYPVEHLYPETQTEVREVRYELRFDARKTYWRYYIQPPPHQRLEDLSIVTADGMPPVPFEGPVSVRLVSGGLAYRFISGESLRLQQRSPYSFRLLGRRAMHAPARDDVLARRLAVAGPDQILPEPTDTNAFKTYSDIFVAV